MFVLGNAKKLLRTEYAELFADNISCILSATGLLVTAIKWSAKYR
jgi:hypothetical protein